MVGDLNDIKKIRLLDLKDRSAVIASPFSVRLVGLIWLHLFIGTLNKNNFLHLEKHLYQESAFFHLEGIVNQNCKRLEESNQVRL